MAVESYRANLAGRVTLRDIAERVGVSINTASFVLNNSRSGTRVSEETRKAIWEAASALGYAPNAVARSLRQSRTNIIGLYSNFDYLQASNLFLSELVGGLQEGCAERGLDLLLHSFTSGASDEAIKAHLSDRRVDGLIYLAPVATNVGALLASGPVPIVSVVDREKGMPCVRVDDAEGGRLQAQYLADQGHRHVLYRAYRSVPDSAREREQSFRSAASELGIEVYSGVPFQSYREFSFKSDEIALLRQSVTAVVCWEDNSAHGTASELEALGFRIPGDVEVVGFNGMRTDLPTRFDLPTVEAPWRDAGHAAIQLLIQLIDGESVATERVLPVRFIHRTSSVVPKEEHS